MTAKHKEPTLESLSLPMELLWNGKLEPLSPPSSELFSLTEPSGNWLYDDNFANGILLKLDDDSEEKPTLDCSQELLNGDLVELCNLAENDHWNKLSITEVSLDYPIESVITSPNNAEKVQSNAFDIDILNSASILTDTTFTQLTPPHSPTPKRSTLPLENNPIPDFNNLDSITTVIPKISANSIVVAAPQPSSTTILIQNINFPIWNNNGSGNLHAEYDNNNHNDDPIAIATQIIDDIVKTRAEELSYYNDDCESQSSYSQADSMEWLPETSSSSSSSSVCSSISSSPNHLRNDEPPQISGNATSTPSKKRTRPYGRGVEDRKIRKKEQNKNAATRYRQKKKLEMESVLNEEQLLTQRNDELKKTFSELNREASYLKKLIRELYSKKKTTR